ncbi:MAG: carbohydrate kinase family protein [Bacteroidales bacterium]
MKKYEVINIADISADLVITGPERNRFGQVETLADAYEIELGGSGPIFASQYAKLGGHVSVLTLIGNDILGDFLLNRMNQVGIDTSLVQRSERSKTPLGLNISVQGDRSMLTVLGTLEEIDRALVANIDLTEVMHWHIAGYFLLPFLIPMWPDFLHQLKKDGITISLDTNWSPEGNWNEVTGILPLIDIFLPNDQEAMAITQTEDYRMAGKQLSQIIPIVVIKRGKEGATVFTQGKEFNTTVSDHWKGEVQLVDTTGAGDSFDGGFLYEWLRGAPMEQCLKTGIHCGTSCVQGTGGIQSQYEPSEKSP